MKQVISDHSRINYHYTHTHKNINESRRMNLLFRNLSYSKWFLTRGIANYVQGQSPEARVREYFYFINHNGMVE